VCDMQAKQKDNMRGVECFSQVRQTGSIVAMDVDVRDSGYLSDIGTRLYLDFQRSGVLLRPLGNTLYVLPPYCVTEQDLDEVYGIISETVRNNLA